MSITENSIQVKIEEILSRSINSAEGTAKAKAEALLMVPEFAKLSAWFLYRDYLASYPLQAESRRESIMDGAIRGACGVLTIFLMGFVAGIIEFNEKRIGVLAACARSPQS